MSTPKKILCVDVECTCWEGRPPNKNPLQRNEIIEIGITPIDIPSRAIELSQSIIVTPPTTEVTEFCTKLTTLTPEYVKLAGIPFRAAMERMDREFRSSKNIFASWGDFDRRSFEKNCLWNEVRNPLSNMNLNVKALFAAKYGYNGGLASCAKDLGLEFDGTHHRGVDDSRMVAKILLVLLGWTNAD